MVPSSDTREKIFCLISNIHACDRSFFLCIFILNMLKAEICMQTQISRIKVKHLLYSRIKVNGNSIKAIRD